MIKKVDALIAEMMLKHPSLGAIGLAAYFEHVHQELAPLARKLEDENESLLALAKFGRWLLDIRLDHIGGELDWADLQTVAEELGLLEEYTATESCGTRCACVDFGDFPQVCLRQTSKAKAMDK